MRYWLPVDPSRRRLVVGILASVVLHVVLVAALLLGRELAPPPVFTKRGEPLLVDIAPDRPKEAAPKGLPDRPIVPDRPAPEPRQARPPAPKTPPAAKAAPPVKAAPAAPPATAQPEPARTPPQVAKAPPEAVSPAPSAPAPPPPAPTARPEAPPAAAPAPQPAEPQTAEAPSRGRQPEVSDPKVSLSRPSLDLPPSIFRRPGAGGGLKGGGQGGVEGEAIPLDTTDPKYQDYFNQIRERIRAKWIYPREAGERSIGGQLLIEFHIARDGRLALVELRRSSGVEILDEYALRAIQLAQPFPPVPATLAKAVLPISGRFTYQIVGDAFVNQYLR